MLTQLRVSNFAIIEHTELDFSSNFNVITGETGAGKSILLGALSLILGERAALSTRTKSDQKTVIESVFQLQEKYKPFFKKYDLDFDAETILRRELLPSGKSRAFINDTPVTLKVLKALSQTLIDVHYQHETMRLTDPSFQTYVLDVFAGNQDLLGKYQTIYQEWISIKERIVQLQEQDRTQQQQKEFIAFQFNELETAQIAEDEVEGIENELNLMRNAEQIATQRELIQQIIHSEGGSFDQLRDVANRLRLLASTSESFEEIESRFSSVILELEDVVQSLEQIQNVELDQERMTFLKERYDLINRLLLKHNVQSEADLLILSSELEQQLLSIDSVKEELSNLAVKKEQYGKELGTIATLLHQQRVSVLPILQEGMVDLLAQIGMPRSIFTVSIVSKEQFGVNGKDQIEFLFSANQGRTPQPMRQVASGGELSRIMLAITTLIADKSDLPTLVFDEIDSGISGEIAKKVGELLAQLSKHHQVISITHSPQVAAKGDAHYKVFKFDEDGVTHSKVEQLKEENRVYELAEMLSGQNPSEISLQTAKELMG